MYSPAADTDLDPPLIRRVAAHRFTPAQLVAIDLVVVVVVIVGVEFLMTRRAPRVTGPGWDAVGWAAYLVAAGATLFRRRAPRLALAVVFPIAVVTLCLRAGGPTVFLVVMTLYSVAVVTARRVASIVTGLVASAILAATLVGGGQQVAQAAIGGVALILLGWLAGENTRASRIYARQRAERAAEQDAAAAAERAEHVSRALADERVQIARDLHDIVAHAMSVIAVRSGVARMVIDSDPEQARDALAIIETTTRRSLHEMRLLVGVLRNPEDQHAALSPVPGLGDLDRLITDTAAAGVAAEAEIDGAARPLPAAADLTAYRIVQEALTNVVRHAGPTHARVWISYRPGEVRVEVTDDGPRGPGPRPMGRAGSGHGLIGMRERVAMFGGELEAGPHAGGFRVRARLPIEDFGSDLPGGDGTR
ncbi:MAG TPA: sensor histidine kinase [Streptosporangiaceae bacterium]|jgi:signal transduction histidine kinase|nr:sensor histidine kinase [Streptosporangiaceae bacterium]